MLNWRQTTRSKNIDEILGVNFVFLAHFWNKFDQIINKSLEKIIQSLFKDYSEPKLNKPWVSILVLLDVWPELGCLLDGKQFN
jgi:hypothetical protein